MEFEERHKLSGRTYPAPAGLIRTFKEVKQRRLTYVALRAP